MNLSGVEQQLQSIAQAVSSASGKKDWLDWLVEILTVVAAVGAAVSAYYSKKATDAVRDTQYDGYRPILRPMDLSDRIPNNGYTLTIKNEGHGPLHNLKLEGSPELEISSLGIGEEKSLNLVGTAHTAIRTAGCAKFTYADIYRRRFLTTVWIGDVKYGRDFIKDWNTQIL